MLLDFIRKKINTPKDISSGIPVKEGQGMPPELMAIQDITHERLEEDLRFLSDDESKVERYQKTAKKEARNAVEQSLKRTHVLQLGRCPQCGEALRQHLFVSVCNACGWSSWSVPRSGSVRIHLTGGGEPIIGDTAYVVKDGVTLILRRETVFARLPSRSVSWIEYIWTDMEKKDRERMVREKFVISCGWCGNDTVPDKEGFHLVHAAFGTTQERYCFCSDDCYEAFRTMYPSRVHRNCYERDCDDCDLCIKRYRSESSGMRTVAKDFLKVKR